MRTAATALRDLSEPWLGGEKVKVAIDRAARLAGIPYWRAFDIWYGKARRIEQFEYDAIAAALDKKNREAARNEVHELRTRITRLESLLAQTDPDFHREEIAALGDQRRSLDRARGVPGRAMAASARA